MVLKAIAKGRGMESSNLTAREIYAQVKSNPTRARFGFGKKGVLVNVDLQKVYTRTDLFKTAYGSQPVTLCQSIGVRFSLVRLAGRMDSGCLHGVGRRLRYLGYTH